jgi:hypothetical protein
MLWLGPPIILLAVLALWWFRGRPLLPVPVVISGETTRLTEPLQEDGTINYVAALDARWREGVTRENNAAVFLIRALGDDFLAREHLHVFKALDMDPPPPQAKTFVSYDRFLRSHFHGSMPSSRPARLGQPDLEQLTRTRPRKPSLEEMAEQAEQNNLGVATTRPWKGGEYPLLAAWLQTNDEPLALALAASQCQRYYVPLATGKKPTRMVDVTRPQIRSVMDLARALVVRGMLRYGSGDATGAWSDVMAAYRLGSLASQSPVIIDRLAALMIAARASSGCRTMATGEGLTAEQARACLADLQALPPVPDMGDVFDMYERYFILDTIAWLAHLERSGELRAQSRGLPALPKLRVVFGYIDWNEILRRANALFDLQVTSQTAPSRATRKQALEAYEQQANAMSARMNWSLWLRPLTEVFSDCILGMSMPSLKSLSQGFEVDRAKVALDRMAMALEGYRLDHGEFPNDLSEVSSAYLKTMPSDPFADQPFRYRRQGKGYILYSVGPNMQDDEGLGQDAKQGTDDIAVEVK